MKVVVFNGSPKSEKGNTAVLTSAFLNGAERAGAQTEEIFLAGSRIEHCNGCFSCWFRTPGSCIHKDDMAGLLKKYNEADIVCFATPVYTWNMTAYLKNFIDRLVPLKSPLLVETDDKYDLKDSQLKTAQFVVISNAGFPGENNFETVRQVFSSCRPVLEIYRNCGMALKKDDSRVKNYLEAVANAGMELAKSGEVCKSTRELMQSELMPVEEYVSMIGM